MVAEMKYKAALQYMSQVVNLIYTSERAERGFLVCTHLEHKCTGCPRRSTIYPRFMYQNIEYIYSC